MLHTSLLLFASAHCKISIWLGSVRKSISSSEFVPLASLEPPSNLSTFAQLNIEKKIVSPARKASQKLKISSMYASSTCIWILDIAARLPLPVGIYFLISSYIFLRSSARDFSSRAFKSTIVGGPVNFILTLHNPMSTTLLHSFSISHTPPALLIIKHFFSTLRSAVEAPKIAGKKMFRSVQNHPSRVRLSPPRAAASNLCPIWIFLPSLVAF